MKNALILVGAGLVGLFIIAGIAGQHGESGADIARRIQLACADEYSTGGEDAVTQCRFRHEVAALGRIDRDREARVDREAGQ